MLQVGSLADLSRALFLFLLKRGKFIRWYRCRHHISYRFCALKVSKHCLKIFVFPMTHHFNFKYLHFKLMISSKTRIGGFPLKSGLSGSTPGEIDSLWIPYKPQTIRIYLNRKRATGELRYQIIVHVHM